MISGVMVSVRYRRLPEKNRLRNGLDEPWLRPYPHLPPPEGRRLLDLEPVLDP